jgi:DNA-binding transcriptional LysR family regulator
VLADIDEMESAVSDMTARARGTLRVNAPMSFGVSHLSTAIAEYQRLQPEVAVDLSLNDRIVDVIGEGFDLAVRITRLDDSSLVARRLAPVRMVVCAAPAYLERHGTPARPADLTGHECLSYAYHAERDTWSFEGAGTSEAVAVRGRFSANNGDALRAAALAGRGIVLLPTFIVGDDLREGRLRELMTDYEIPLLSVYAVYAHRQYLSAKVRTFVDFLAGYFGTPPYWDRSP